MSDVKDAVGSMARLFWIYQGFAVAAALLAFLPDQSSTYNEAIAELRRLQAIRISVDVTERALQSSAQKQVGDGVLAAMRAAADPAGIKLSDSLPGNSTYFLIEKGPLTLDFGTTPVSDVLDAVSVYRGNPHFVVAVPKEEALAPALRDALAGETGLVTNFNIACNYAESKCQGAVYIDPDGDEAGLKSIVEFYVPRRDVELTYGVRDLIETRYPGLKDNWHDVSALSRVRSDIAELKPVDAIAKLQDMRKADDRPLSVLDVSFSGANARLLAPVILAILAFAAWVSATGFAALRPSAADIASSLFLPLINTPPAHWVRVVTLIFPIVVTEGFLLRGWNGNLWGFGLAVVALALQSYAAICLFNVFGRLRSVGTRRQPDRIEPKGAGAVIILSALVCALWGGWHQPARLPAEAVRASASTLSTASPEHTTPRAEEDAMARAIDEIRRKEEGMTE